MNSGPQHVLFLPGAGGDGAFWAGVGERLPAAWHKQYLSWPGLGHQPADPAVRGMADLVRLAEQVLRVPSTVVAQSMGGVVALELALRHPQLVSRLVLVATSGGLDVAALGAADWRAEYRAAFPQAAPWIMDAQADLGAQLPALRVPTLLLWGDNDPISPVAVGQHLATQIAGSRLVVLAGGTHAMGVELAQQVAPLIAQHVMAG